MKVKNRERKRFSKIEDHLKNYRNYIAGIENMQQQLDHIMPNITANYTVSEGTVGTFVFKSSTEDFAIDRIESKKALKLHEDIAVYQLLVSNIDNAIKQLKDKEKKFVKIHYIEDRSVEEAAEAMDYSSRNLYFVKEKIRDQLMISLKNIANIEI